MATKTIENKDDFKKIIETTIETKFNQLLETIPQFIKKEEIKDENDFFNISMIDIYKNTIQTIIDIINDITHLLDISTNYDNIFIQQFSNLRNYHEATNAAANNTIEIITNFSKVAHCLDNNFVAFFVI